MKNECKGIFGKLLGHKYRARYSKKKGASQLEGKIKVEGGGKIEKIIEGFRDVESLYECDICIRCGNKVGKNGI